MATDIREAHCGYAAEERINGMIVSKMKTRVRNSRSRGQRFASRRRTKTSGVLAPRQSLSTALFLHPEGAA